mgnify:CR=1 FL=1
MMQGGGRSESASGDCKCFSQKQDGTFENVEAIACVMSQTVVMKILRVNGFL